MLELAMDYIGTARELVGNNTVWHVYVTRQYKHYAHAN